MKRVVWILILCLTTLPIGSDPLENELRAILEELKAARIEYATASTTLEELSTVAIPDLTQRLNTLNDSWIAYQKAADEKDRAYELKIKGLEREVRNQKIQTYIIGAIAVGLGIWGIAK